MSDAAPGSQRAPAAVMVVLMVAIVMSVDAASGWILDCVPSAERRLLTETLAEGVVAIVLLAVCWRWTPRGGRVLIGIAAITSAFGVLGCALRLWR